MNSKLLISLSLLAMLVILACGLGDFSMAPPSPPVNPVDPEQIAQAISATFAAQTQLAVYVQQTLTAVALQNPTLPPQAGSTPTLVFTATPSATPVPTLSLALTTTPNPPMVTVSSETNCRSGPGRMYDKLGVLNPGETTEVVGRTTVPNYWLVRNPDNPAQICWLWGQYATVTGDWQSLPQATPPPTPIATAPAAAFHAVYLSTLACSGNYSFRIQLTNVGTVKFESYRVEVNDTTNGILESYQDDFFTDYTTCAMPANTLQDLEPAEVGVVVNRGSSQLPYSPAGHNITVTFTLCSQNGLTGTCATKTLHFVP